MSDAADQEIERFLRAHGPFEKPPVLACGDSVGEWKVRAFLGHGGSAQVYRAENETTGLVAALKLLSRSDDRTRARFRRETLLLAKARSASFPKFYGAGEIDGRLYIAEELLEPMPLPDEDAAVARFVLEVADGVEELHRQGFVHRDIKPGNVMMRAQTGESVLIDMGLTKESENTPEMANDTTSVVDGRAVGVGTPGFSAPEQFVDGRVGVAADIHALGMLANTCFGGKPPRSWMGIVRRSTSSIPEQRYPSIAAFTRAIRRRHVLRWWFFGICAALAIVLILIAWLSPRDAKMGKPVGTTTEKSEATMTNKTTSSNGFQERMAETLLEATYRLHYSDNTNISRKAALEALRKGIPPSL